MATELSVSGIVDLLDASYEDFDEPKFHQIATRLQRYEVMGRLMRKSKRVWGGPHGVSRQIMTDHSGAAREEGLHAVRTYRTNDVMAQMNVPWRHINTYYAYERREFLMNTGPKRIFNLIKQREAMGLISLAELMESRFWSAPPSSSDELRVFGIFYWLTYNATTGINGANQTNFSSGRGGISSSTYTRWKNGTANYSKLSKGDGIERLRDVADDCNFESPVDIADFRKGRGDTFRIYCGKSTRRAFENVGESQNENLGRDVASMDGVITFRRNPIIRVPKLDNMTTSAPIIGINWDWARLAFLKGDYLHRHKPRGLDAQPNTIVVDIDLTWQLFFEDMRSHFLVAKADPLDDPNLP